MRPEEKHDVSIDYAVANSRCSSTGRALLTKKTGSKYTDLKGCRACDKVLHRLVKVDHTGHDDSEDHLCGYDAIHLLDETPAEHVVKFVEPWDKWHVFQRLWVSKSLYKPRRQITTGRVMDQSTRTTNRAFASLLSTR